MALHVNLKQLESGPKDFEGEIPIADLDMEFDDELVKPKSGIQYEFRAEIHETNLLLRGRLSQSFDFECARCLKPFTQSSEISDWSQLVPLAGEDEIEVNNECVDLTPILREDMLLTLPQHPLCVGDCKGLDSESPDPAPGSAGEQNELSKPSSAWTALDQLHLE